jgi:hypothetical protein
MEIAQVKKPGRACRQDKENDPRGVFPVVNPH